MLGNYIKVLKQIGLFASLATAIKEHLKNTIVCKTSQLGVFGCYKLHCIHYEFGSIKSLQCEMSNSICIIDERKSRTNNNYSFEYIKIEN